MNGRIPYDASVQAMADGSHPLRRAPDCCRGAIVGFHHTTGRIAVIPARCHRWSCPHCAAEKASAIAARLFKARPERHITLTCNPHAHATPFHALKAMKAALPKLVNELRAGKQLVVKGRKQFDADGEPIWVIPPRRFEYCAIWERHDNGYPHVHIAQHGDWIRQARLSAIWSKLTAAPIVHIKSMADAVPTGHHWTKYLIKALPHTASIYEGFRLVSFSRGYDRHGSTRPAIYDEGGWTWLFTFDPPDDIAHTIIFLYHCQELEEEGGLSCFAAEHLALPHTAYELDLFLNDRTARATMKDLDQPGPDVAPPRPIPNSTQLLLDLASPIL